MRKDRTSSIVLLGLEEPILHPIPYALNHILMILLTLTFYYQLRAMSWRRWSHCPVPSGFSFFPHSAFPLPHSINSHFPPGRRPYGPEAAFLVPYTILLLLRLTSATIIITIPRTTANGRKPASTAGLMADTKHPPPPPPKELLSEAALATALTSWEDTLSSLSASRYRNVILTNALPQTDLF